MLNVYTFLNKIKFNEKYYINKKHQSFIPELRWEAKLNWKSRGKEIIKTGNQWEKMNNRQKSKLKYDSLNRLVKLISL